MSYVIDARWISDLVPRARYARMVDLNHSTALRIGELVVVYSDDGPLDTEYALFDPGEVVLHSASRIDVREDGYLTTAADARTRLARAGVTAELAEAAARAIPVPVLEALARTPALTEVASKLGPSEIFDGGKYTASDRSYDGTWIDLRALAKATGLRDAPSAIQALFLAAVLAEIDADVPVHLSTAKIATSLPPGARSHRRPSLVSVRRLPAALAELRAPQRAAAQELANPQEHISALRRSIRHRTTLTRLPATRERMQVIESALEVDEAAQSQRPSTYVKAKAALERGDDQLEHIAQMLSGLSARQPGYFEVTLLAARAWLAAGDHAKAKSYAKTIVDDASAPDGVRLAALDILSAPEDSDHALPNATPPAQQSLPGASRPPMAHETVLEGEIVLTPTPSPVEIAVYEERVTRPQLTREPPEIVESMPLPDGLTEDMLASGQAPRTPEQARIAMTRIARELAREYRVTYNTTLKTDVMSIETMQRHLRRRATAPVDEKMKLELQRHGALLSEIIARRLRGHWIDVTPAEVGYWAMIVPPGTHVTPIGRVFRFFSMGPREKDLVAYFTDLELRARP